jgi:Transposase DDE domain
MTSQFSNVLQKFINRSPVTVMVQGLLEQILNEKKLNSWFEANRGRQYTSELLFSTVVALMLEVVCQMRASVHVAYRNTENMNVSLASLYNKLNGMKTETSAALVRYVAQQSAAIIRELKAELPALLPGYQTKLLDGNCIEASHHRLKVLRDTKAGALPGKSLVVFDPQLELAIDVFPCEDGHAQERSLLDKVLLTVMHKDLWVADRNFCTQDFLFGIREQGGFFVVREHQLMPVLNPEELVFIGSSETGDVFEQKVTLKSATDIEYSARRIIVKLNKKTRNDDDEIRILTNLEKDAADAVKIAEIYRERWGIETAFQRIEGHFNSEINTLGYPKAALFGFCLALIAFNLYAVVMAALRVAHPETNIKEEVSEYYIASDIRAIYSGMVIAVDYQDWAVFREATLAQMVVLLVDLARTCNTLKLKKKKRGVKKPKVELKLDKSTPHVSTLKLLSGNL